MEEKNLVYGNWNSDTEYEWISLSPQGGLAAAEDNAKRFTIPGTDCTVVLNLINKTYDLVLAKERPTHSHKHEQIIIFVEGDGDAVVDGKHYPLTDGSFIVVPPNVEHKVDCRSTTKNIINFDIFTPTRNEYVVKKQK
ncbi:MAG: cupin domain-containing protein [Eubacteriales bacterium]